MFKKSNIPGDVTPKPAAKDATTTVAEAKKEAAPAAAEPAKDPKKA